MAVFAFLMLLFVGVAGAAPPANDDFANPIPLVEDGVDEAGGSTWQATAQVGEPDHGGDPGGASVWYSWISKRSGPITVRACGGGWGIVVAAYSGATLDGLEPLAFGRATARSECAWMTFRGTPGVAYRIAVDGHRGSGEVARGTFTLEVRRSGNVPSAPTNDAFERPTVLGSAAYARLFARTDGASREPGEPAHQGEPFGASVWFRWVAPTSGVVELHPCRASFPPAIAVYTGTALDALSLVSVPGNDGAQALAGDCQLGGAPGVNFPAVAGVTYSIAIDGVGGEWGEASFLMEPRREPFVDIYPPATAIRKIIRLPARRGFRALLHASLDGSPTSFRCRLDRRPYRRCESPVQFLKLRPGRHRLAIYAVDGAGNRDPTPVVRKLRIGRGKGKFRVPRRGGKSGSGHRQGGK